MPNFIKHTLVFLTVLNTVVFCHALLEAEQSKTPIVVGVRVKGNQAISTPTILSKIMTKPAQPFSQEVINDDVKRLYAMGYFTDVAVDIEDYEGGIMVTIVVEEKPVVGQIIFEGNKKMGTRRLLKVMQTKTGDMLNFGKLSEDITELKSFYERNGFSRVGIKYKVEKDKDTNQATIKITVDEEKRMRVKRVFIKGNKAVKSGKIKDLMETRPAWFFRRGYFEDDTFENDMARIKAYYQDLGFLDVTVAPRLDYDEEKGTIIVTLTIEEGDEYKVGNVEIKGRMLFPEEEVTKRIISKTGQPFSYSKLREDVESIRAYYYHNGYMNADILVDRSIEPKTRTVNLFFDVDAKDIVYIGTVDIKGNTKTKDIVIRRELRVYPGERFDGDKLRRSKERLYNLGFFEDIYFETKATNDPNVDNLEIMVKETKTGEFAFGGGYSSIDEFIGFVQVMQKNFDLLNFPYFTGDGQNLSIRAEIGTVRSDYDLSWTEPWIFDYPLSFGFDAYHRTHLRRTDVGYGYKEERTGGDFRFGKEFIEYIRTDLMYRLETIDISDISDEATQDLKDEAGRNWLSSVILGASFDNRDNIFSPTKGFVVGTTLENTGGFLLGDKSYVKGYFWTSFYYSPFKSIVIELRGRAGLADSYGDTDKVPIYERYYAGGAETIRGYRERKVGPRDPQSNDPTGGNSLLIGNIELTFPLYEKIIKGAVFYDIGNVWEKMGDFAVGGNYKMGAGVGVRVKTPIGPLKLDWGYPLSPNHDDEQRGEFYFSVSHGF